MVTEVYKERASCEIVSKDYYYDQGSRKQTKDRHRGHNSRVIGSWVHFLGQFSTFRQDDSLIFFVDFPNHGSSNWHFPSPASKNRQIPCPDQNYNPESRSPLNIKCDSLSCSIPVDGYHIESDFVTRGVFVFVPRHFVPREVFRIGSIKKINPWVRRADSLLIGSKKKYSTIIHFHTFFCFTYFVFCVFVSLTAVRISRSVHFFTSNVLLIQVYLISGNSQRLNCHCGPSSL